MRVITGSARGRKLETLPGDIITRPTTQNVKEAIFSMIQFEIEGKNVLDLFSGSGQLGIEALSRGALTCTFIDKNYSASQIIQKNIENCGFQKNSRLITSDAFSFLERKHNFDIVFVDPPYNNGMVPKAVEMLIKSVDKDGIIICETAYNESIPDFPELLIHRERRYSKTKITVFRKK